jgi:hypothetical protein
MKLSKSYFLFNAGNVLFVWLIYYVMYGVDPRTVDNLRELFLAMTVSTSICVGLLLDMLNLLPNRQERRKDD